MSLVLLGEVVVGEDALLELGRHLPVQLVISGAWVVYLVLLVIVIGGSVLWRHLSRSLPGAKGRGDGSVLHVLHRGGVQGHRLLIGEDFLCGLRI